MARHARRVVFQNLAFAMSVILVLLVSALVFQLNCLWVSSVTKAARSWCCLNGLRLLAYRNSFSAVVAAPWRRSSRSHLAGSIELGLPVFLMAGQDVRQGMRRIG